MASDLTPAQNERLRRAMLSYRKEFCDDDTTELARRLERSQPSISVFLNRKGGASFATARAFARLVKQDVDTLLGPEAAGPDEDMPAPAQPTVLSDRVHATITRVARANGYSEDALAHALATRGLQGMSDMSEADADDLLRLSDTFVRSAQRIISMTIVRDSGGSALDDLSGGASRKVPTKRR